MGWREVLRLKKRSEPDYSPLTKQQFYYLWAIGHLHDQGEDRTTSPDIHATVQRLADKSIKSDNYFQILDTLEEYDFIQCEREIGVLGKGIDRYCTITPAGKIKIMEIKQKNNLHAPKAEKPVHQR